jgi:cold shock CspA family protein
MNYKLFDDPFLDRHIRNLSLQKSPEAPKRKVLETKNVHYGTVSRWHVERGFGFVLSDGPLDGIPDKEVFCHRTSLPKGYTSLEPRARVEFTLHPAHLADKPPQARVTRVLDAAGAA